MIYLQRLLVVIAVLLSLVVFIICLPFFVTVFLVTGKDYSDKVLGWTPDK
jgi:Na+/glutamate symporter